MITIQLEVLDSTWELAGLDRETLAKPEQIQVTSNTGGFDTCSWTLRRDMAAWPDLSAFTPCEIWEDGVCIFEGRVQEAPMRKDPDDTLITVSGRGWQYQEDDDASVPLSWVRTALTDWVDSRSLPACTLGSAGHFAAPQVGAGDGVLAFTIPNGTAYPAGGRVGATLDFKQPELGPKRVVAAATTSDNDASLVWYLRSSNSQNPVDSTDVEDAISATPIDASHLFAATIATRRRYLHLFLYRAAGATYAGDVWAKVNGFACFRDAALESGRASVLTSSQIIKDALPWAPLLSQDTSGIEETAFHWPDFHLTEPRTFREVADAANAAHRWQLKVAPGRRVLFRPQRTVPKYAAPARAFEDASAHSGEELYNKAVVVGTGPDGQALQIERYSAHLPGVASEPVTSPAFVNPSADINASSWSANADASVTRSTGTFHSAPASFFLGVVGANGVVTATMSGTWERGVGYVLRGRYRPGGADRIQVRLEVGVGTDMAYTVATLEPAVWTLVDVVWVPRAQQTAPTFRVVQMGGYALFADSLEVRTARPTLIDKRRFVRSKRLDVSAPLLAEVGNQFCDAFLQSHLRTPMRGSATLAPGDLFDYQSGALVHPRVLVAEGGELIHFSDIIDPDTGAFGRDGMIASVVYDPDTEVATVPLDNQRDNHEALIARYAVVAGGSST